MHISKIFLFYCKRVRLKLVIFLFYDLATCHKKAEILLLATILMAHTQPV